MISPTDEHKPGNMSYRFYLDHIRSMSEQWMEISHSLVSVASRTHIELDDTWASSQTILKIGRSGVPNSPHRGNKTMISPTDEDKPGNTTYRFYLNYIDAVAQAIK